MLSREEGRERRRRESACTAKPLAPYARLLGKHVPRGRRDPAADLERA